MEQKVITSEKYSLAWRDVLKSLVMTVITAVITSVYEAIQKEGDLANLNYKTIGVTALIAGFGYLIKNGIFEPPKTIVVSGTNAEAKSATKEVKQVV